MLFLPDKILVVIFSQILLPFQSFSLPHFNLFFVFYSTLSGQPMIHWSDERIVLTKLCALTKISVPTFVSLFCYILLLNKWLLIWRLFSLQCCVSKKFFSKLVLVLLSLPPHIKKLYICKKALSQLLLIKNSLYHNLLLASFSLPHLCNVSPSFSKESVWIWRNCFSVYPS